MVTEKAIATEITIFKTIFSRQINADELKVLFFVWGEAFKDFSDAEFIEACEEVRRTNKFFPVPADVLTAIENLRKSIKQTPLYELEAGTNASKEEKWRAAIIGMVCIKSLVNKTKNSQVDIAMDTSRKWQDREKAARQFLGKDFKERD